MLWLQCIHFLLFLNTSQSFPILLSTGTVLGSSQELSWRLVTLNTKIPKRYDDVNGHDLSRIRKLDFFFKINLLWDQGRESSVIIVIQTVQRSLELWCVMMIICKLNCFHSGINSWCYAPLKSKHQHPPPPGQTPGAWLFSVPGKWGIWFVRLSRVRIIENMNINEEQKRAKLTKLGKRHSIVKQHFYKSFGIQYHLYLHCPLWIPVHVWINN